MRYEQPVDDATVADGAATVQINATKTANTFGEYSTLETGDKVQSLLSCVQQLDIVFDVYQRGSRKKEMRERRGKKDGVRLSIKENTPINRKFAKVLKLDDNKTELLNLIAVTMSGLFRNQQNVLLITRQQTVLSNREVNLQRLPRCYKVEADEKNLPACQGTVTIRIQEADDSHNRHRCSGYCPVCLLGSQCN